VAALPHPRHDPRLRSRGGGPAPPSHRHDLLFRPALERAGRNPRTPRSLAERNPFVGHRTSEARRRGRRAAGTPTGTGPAGGPGSIRPVSPRPSEPAAPARRPPPRGRGAPPPPAGRTNFPVRPPPRGRGVVTALP